MSSNATSILDTNPNKEQFIIGMVYCVITALAFPFYIPIVYTIRVTKELNENISYKLINTMNIGDLTQSFLHFLTGIFIIFPVLTRRIGSFVKLVGYTNNCLFNSSFVIIAVLAMIRIGVTFFQTKTNKWRPWMLISLFIGGSYMFTVWLMGCLVLCFQLYRVNWSYNMDVPLSTFLSAQELWFCFAILIFSFTSYLIILWSIYNKKRQTQSESSHRTEIAILTQATVITIYMGTMMILWHNAERWFEMTDITLALLNGQWIMFIHLNSFLLIFTNKSIREQLLSMIGRNKKRKSSKTGVSGVTMFVHRTSPVAIIMN